MIGGDCASSANVCGEMFLIDTHTVPNTIIYCNSGNVCGVQFCSHRFAYVSAPESFGHAATPPVVCTVWRSEDNTEESTARFAEVLKTDDQKKLNN